MATGWREEEFVESGLHHYDAYTYPAYQNVDYDVNEVGRPEAEYRPIHSIPSPVQNFLLYFQKVIKEQDVLKIQSAYIDGFSEFTERFYQSTPWPDARDLSHIIDNEIFDILYKELYFRHIYAKVTPGPTLDQRIESYYNYCDLFNLMLGADEPVSLELPNQWLWDIIDEFIYQFQSFSQYRCKAKNKSTEDTEKLLQNQKVWNVHSVLNVLHSLVDKSNINQQLEVMSKPEIDADLDMVAGEFGRHTLYKMLGYFSLIGLLRLHSLLGDYYQALKVLENIDFNSKSLGTFKVPSCQITTYYYMAFAYMMMRRYQDAIRTLSNILLYIQRTKQIFQNRQMLYDNITKQSEQMSTLLAICLTLHPMRIDESVHSQLKEKYGEKMLKMQNGDNSEFESCFAFACPKFLSPVIPVNYDNMNPNYHKEPFQQQLTVFIDEIREQNMLHTIRSYLKLYTTLPLSKLANFMKTDDNELKMQLMCFKHKMKNLVWVKGTNSLEGEFQTASEIDFYIHEGMIHIADTKVDRRYGNFFIRQIHKFDEINRALKNIIAM